MSRPSSILMFERLYLGSILVYVVNAAVFWTTTRETMLQSRQVQDAPALAPIMGGIMIGSVVAVVLVSLLLWWLVARARSTVAKWLVVATEAVGMVLAALSILSFARGTAANVPGLAVGLVGTLLAVVAAAMLFRPDARAWFATDTADVTG